MASLWTYRQFIWEAALADLRHRYAGSGLGVFWNVVTPLAMLAIYTLLFSTLLGSRQGMSATSTLFLPLYIGSGFLPWAAFADCLVRATNAFVANSAYLKKTPIPEQVFVAQAAVSATVSMLIAVLLLVMLAFLLGEPVRWTWLLLPLVVLLWQCFGFGLGLGLSTLNLFFRDIGQVLGVLLQVWMWSLPVVYLEDLLPAAYRTLLPFNPGYAFVTTLRELYLSMELPQAHLWAAMLAWASAAIAFGYGLLHRLRSDVRDVL
jgi:ABC-type polysaccharide/polyol phosphate export permease